MYQNKIKVLLPQNLLKEDEIKNLKQEITSEQIYLDFYEEPYHIKADWYNTFITIIIFLSPLLNDSVNSAFYDYAIKPLIDKLIKAKREKKLTIYEANKPPKPANLSIKVRVGDTEISTIIEDDLTEDRLKELFDKIINSANQLESQPNAEKYYIIQENKDDELTLLSMHQYIENRNKKKNTID